MGKKSRGKAASGTAKERPVAAKPRVISLERVIPTGHTEEIWAVAISPDGRRVISGSQDSTLRVWDLADDRCVATLKGHTASVRGVAVHPDGRRAISGSQDGTLRVWDLEGGRCLAKLQAAADGGQGNRVRLRDLFAPGSSS
jgi:WD40 repeat protein